MTDAFKNVYVTVKVIGILGLLVWAACALCSFVPFAPFCPPDLVPHPHPLPGPTKIPEVCTVD